MKAFWTERIRAEPLAAFRIVAGVAIAISVVFGMGSELTLFFSDGGLVPGSVADEVLRSSGRFSLKRLPGGFFDGAIGTWILFVVLLGALGLVIVGRHARVAAAVAYVLLSSFTQRSLTLTNGGDDLAVQALFYLMLAPAGAAWVLGRPSSGDGTIAPWSVRLLQIQLCLIYFSTGLSKLNLEGPRDWLTGEAVYWALNDLTLTRWSFAALPVPLWLCRLLSWGTLAFELSFAFLVWIPRLRRYVLLGGVGLHLGILLTMQVGFFSTNILAYYLLFVSPEALERFRAWLGSFEPRRLAHVS